MTLLKKITGSLNLNLRKLILFLVVFSVTSLFLISLVVSYYIQKQQLIENSLSVNLEYATKIAKSADNHFQTMTKELAYSANILGQNFDNPTIIHDEVKRLKNQSDHFSLVLVFDHQGKIKDFSPENINLKKNLQVETLGVLESLKFKKTYISPPFYSATHNLVVIVTQPIFDKNKKYLGFISGNISLKEKNIISELLTMRYGYKDSYMYVIDKSNRIIFHPNQQRIGELIKNNTGLPFMNKVGSGKIRLVNSQGVDSLAGFAHLPTTNWIVVSQQPTEALLRQADSILYKVGTGIIFFYILIFFTVGRISSLISSPLNNLAKMASYLNHTEVITKIKSIEAWYFEINRFKQSLLLSAQNFSEKISELNIHVNTDPLTGLYNRRGMEIFVKEFINSGIKFCVVSIDIDYFKKINDSYGHYQGDVVLEKMAQHIQDNFRSEDVCCRIGGEEFIVLTPMTETKQAYAIAERLRCKLETTMIDSIGPITVSIGIAHWPHTSTDIKEVFKATDDYLYQAKIDGRNCIRYSTDSNEKEQ